MEEKNDRCVTLSTFIYKLKEINKIEYNIAMKKNKLSKHFTKWKNIEFPE